MLAGIFMLMPKRPEPLIETFRKYTIVNGENQCWPWFGPVDQGGYGMMSGKPFGFSSLRAHRFSYMHHIGPIPRGGVVRHSCDNPECVNPAHLLVGTQLDNIQDRVKRGRTRTNQQSKLSLEQIFEVRRMASAGVYQRDIAKQFGVCQRTINKIVNRLDGYRDR